MKKNALGRGLSALINNDYEVKDTYKASGNISEIDLDAIEINPFQPRTEFKEELLKELAESILHFGIIQPITVTQIEENKYRLIAGERRLRASRLAGLTTIPAFVREANDSNILQMALVENIQRQDLNPIEIALSYQRLIEECNVTQETLSQQVGKNRSTITNFLRLLKLPGEVQIGLRDQLISVGHARALINIEDKNLQIKLFFRIINEGLSVRDVEKIVKEFDGEVPEKQARKPHNKITEKFRNSRKNLSEKFNTKVELKRDEKGKGKIIIQFQSDEDFDRIVQLLDNEKTSDN